MRGIEHYSSCFRVAFIKQNAYFALISQIPPITNDRNCYEKIYHFLLFTYISSFCIAQTYKYLGVEDGLSNRRIYAIQKGPKGYMWFLTHNGIDRYDGKNFKQYRLIDSEIEVNSMLNLSWLYVGVDGTLWEIGKKEEYSAMMPNMIDSNLYTSYLMKW